MNCSANFRALLVAVLAFATTAPVWAAGDAARGRQLATECFACHGPDGNSPSPVNPRIGGQHESYLLLALQAYLDGTRQNSLMRGAILNKSPQDLQDIAAYYASQGNALVQPSAAGASPGPRGPQGPQGPGGPRGPGGPGGPPGSGVIKFDHGERTAAFTALLARARSLAEPVYPLSPSACAGFKGGANADRDGDGLADAHDAAPENPAEFVRDTNGDGRYEICNIEQLQAVVTLGGADGKSSPLSLAERRARSYQLVRDLDASGIANFQPIGDCGPTGNCMRALGEFGFSGILDGRGHVIRNLRIDYPERGGVGLFGVLAEAGVVMNLRLENARVVGRAGTGALVGSNFGVVYHCESEGSVEASMALGGLVGGSGGLVYASHSAGQVTGQQAVGGLVGDMTGAVYSSSSTASVSGQRGIGGLVGLNTFGAVLGSRASGSVSGTNDVGGLVGVNTDAKVRNSSASGTVKGDGTNVGGLVGFNSLSTVRNSFATGLVNGQDAVGGLVGRNNGAVARSFAVGEVSSPGQADPLIGAVVEGSAAGNYSGAQARSVDAESSGWSPVSPPPKELLDYFCDRNENGFIDPSEQSAGNYVWRFEPGALPALRCIADDRTAAAD